MTSDDKTTAIIAMLAMLAEQCGEVASSQRLAFMAKELASHEGMLVAEALRTMMRSARKFPTVVDIEKEMGVGLASVDPDTIGREVAERMYSAVRRFRSTKANREKVEAFIGPVGIEVVRLLGGWEYVCETTFEETSTIHKAQWREIAAVIAHKMKRGDIDLVPGAQLAPAPKRDGLKLVNADSMAALVPSIFGGNK